MFENKRTRMFIKDIKRVHKGEIAYCRHWQLVGDKGIGKTLLATRIKKALPNIIVADEITKVLRLPDDCPMCIYTSNERTALKSGVYSLQSKLKQMKCPIVESKSDNIKDIIKQIKKMKFA